MFHVETALDDAALIARLCDRDHENRRQHLAMAVDRRHAFIPT
jgi:hypothetical protein